MRYEVRGIAEVEIITIVEAENEKEAEKIVEGRDVEICIHGSELCDKHVPDDEWILTDGTYQTIRVDSVEEEL